LTEAQERVAEQGAVADRTEMEAHRPQFSVRQSRRSFQKPLVPFHLHGKGRKGVQVRHLLSRMLPARDHPECSSPTRQLLQIDSQYQKWWVKSAYQDNMEPLPSEQPVSDSRRTFPLVLSKRKVPTSRVTW
jgi:hypothetical protein